MGKNAIIALIIVIVVLITGTLVATIIFLPSSEIIESGLTYDALNKTEYKYTETKVLEDKEEDHQVTQNTITEGIKNYDYIPGRDNPFTPITDVNIYNEPGTADKTHSYIDRNAGDRGSTTKGSNSSSAGSSNVTSGGSSK